jgi:hypothetical protein
MNLESELRSLDVEWPATPRFVLAPRRRRWPIAAAIAAAAVIAAFAVPQSRGAILRLFHIGGATIRVVDALPRVDERPLAAGLGPAVPRQRARSVGVLLVPSVAPAPATHLAPGNVVSILFRVDGRPVLLSEFPGGYFLKKLAAGQTRMTFVRVRGTDGAWLGVARHVVVFPGKAARLAGNVLIWADGATTYRLEGPGLTKARALGVAASLRRG